MIGQGCWIRSEDQMAMIKMLKCVFIRMDGQCKQELKTVGAQEGKLESKSITTEIKYFHFNRVTDRPTKSEE